MSIQQVERFGAHNYHPLPILVSRAQGIYIYGRLANETEDRRYIDMLSSYSALNQGHCHPRILQAARDQLDRVTLTSRAFHNDQLGPFLERLSNVSGFARALPMNSGAEAVETGLKAVRKWGYQKKGVSEGKARIIVASDNFHGRTITIISFSTEAQYRQGFGPFTPGFDIVPYGDVQALASAITPDTVAVLVEPIQGEAGILMPPPGYQKQLRALCTENRVLLFLDEIQTGLGRTGKIWAFEHEEIRPDCIAVGKALGGGVYPVSAFCSTEEVMSVFGPGDHGSTFGGNPLAAAIGVAALGVLLDENLAGNAQEQGDFFMRELKALDCHAIKEVRGKGLLIGVELDRPARPVCEQLMQKGVLCKDTHSHVIRFAPPLTIQRSELIDALQAIRSVFQELS
jgi:ornithine--oxo-acid transaminase